MQVCQVIKYTIFQTQWGFFGLAGSENEVSRTSLPVETRSKAEILLTGNLVPASNLENLRFEQRLFSKLQNRITAYFNGSYIDFSDVPLVLDGLTAFGREVLTACRKIPYSRTASYARLAELAARPRAVRAVGNILSRNPLPLLIPCHRIIRTNGRIGGFTAAGGTKLKQKMLKLEQKARL